MKPNDRSPLLLLSLLAAWLIAGTVAISWTDTAPDTPYLAYALLIFVAAVGLVNLFPFSWLAVLGIGLGAYNAVVLSLHPLTAAAWLPLGVGNLAILGAGLLSWAASLQIARLQKNLEHSRNVIDELRVKDPVLGIVRLSYALQTLKIETLRSQRYQSKLCLALIQIADVEAIQKEQGAAAFQEIKSQVCSALSALIREMDTLFGQDPFGIILPETSSEAAMVVARRVIDNLARKVRVGVHIGIAEFGVDAFSDDELYRAAETALNLAERTDKAVVNYAQVQSITEPDLSKS